MGPALVSFLFTVGATTWFYTKLQKYSGNNTKQSVIAASIAALIVFLLFYSILTLFMK